MKAFAVSVVVGLFLFVLMASGQPTPTSGPGGVPEIDPSSAATALALLTGAGLIIRSRFKR